MPSRIILFVQVVAHAATLMFSLMVMVPMSVHQEHFRGKCILFSTGTWQEMDGQFKVRRGVFFAETTVPYFYPWLVS